MSKKFKSTYGDLLKIAFFDPELGHTHITVRLGIYEDYLVDALNHDGISLTIISLGVPTAHESELKNLEHLRDAGLFIRDVRWSRSGRNKSYIYKLTKEGKDLAEKIRKEKVDERRTFRRFHLTL